MITIAITSFCRWGYLRACLQSLDALPNVQVLVADDSFTDICANIVGPECIRLTPDAGLTCKRNALVQKTTTPYWFCGSDDFDFSTPGFKEGLAAAEKILTDNPNIDIVGGRCNNIPYEFNLTHDLKENVIREMKLAPSDAPFKKCDLVVNAFLARTSTLLQYPWSETVRPIGGEHGQFFWHLKKANRNVVWLPGFNINTLSLGQGEDVQDPKYAEYRRRAFACGHTIMLKEEGIKDWIGADWSG